MSNEQPNNGADTMTTARREQLEMAGYQSGRRGDHTCYNRTDWSKDEADAFRKGYNDGAKMFETLGK